MENRESAIHTNYNRPKKEKHQVQETIYTLNVAYKGSAGNCFVYKFKDVSYGTLLPRLIYNRDAQLEQHAIQYGGSEFSDAWALTIKLQ